MALLDKFFGGKKTQQNAVPAPRLMEGVPLGLRLEKPVLTITDEAKQKVRSILEGQGENVRTIRVSAPMPGKYAMNLEPEGKPQVDDSVLPYEGFEVFVDPNSLKYVEGATLTWV